MPASASPVDCSPPHISAIPWKFPLHFRYFSYISAYAPNLSDCFFELFLDIHAKGLIQKDVVEHKFIGDGRKGGKGYTLLYSHTRMRARREQISTGRKGRIAVSHS